MTIASEITRLQWAKANIRVSIWNKWVDVPSNIKLDNYSTYIDQIQTGTGDDILSYFSGILSLDSGQISISNSDLVRNRYSDYTWKDGDTLFMVKPYEYDNYSSTWHSYMETYVDCIALDKWASSTIEYRPMIIQAWYYTTTNIRYYYINWNSIKIYWTTWEYVDSPWCKELVFNNDSWSVQDIGWDWNTPADIWGNQNILYSTVVWSTSWWGVFFYKWRPN